MWRPCGPLGRTFLSWKHYSSFFNWLPRQMTYKNSEIWLDLTSGSEHPTKLGSTHLNISIPFNHFKIFYWSNIDNTPPELLAILVFQFNSPFTVHRGCPERISRSSFVMKHSCNITNLKGNMRKSGIQEITYDRFV